MAKNKELEKTRDLLEQKIFSAYMLSEDFKKAEEEYKVKKNDLAAEISALSAQLKSEDFIFEYEPNSLTKRHLGIKQNDALLMSCKRIKPMSVKYDESAMLKDLGKDEINALFDKSYEIVDMSNLIAFLKKYGVPAKEFKKYILVNHKLSKERLDHLYEIGVIKMDDLKKFCMVSKKPEYWKISAKVNE